MWMTTPAAIDGDAERVLSTLSDGGRVECIRRRSAFGMEPTRLHVWFGGRLCEADVIVSGSAEDPDELGGVKLRIATSAPLRLLLGDATTGSLSLPRALTGDPTFDATFRLFGAPPEFAAQIFDPQMRADLFAGVANDRRRLANLWIEHADGILEHPLRFHVDAEGALTPPLDALRAEIAFALRLADRVGAAFAAARAVARARGGAAEEARLVASATATAAGAAATQKRNRKLILGALLGAVVFTLLAVLAAVLGGAASCGSL